MISQIKERTNSGNDSLNSQSDYQLQRPRQSSFDKEPNNGDSEATLQTVSLVNDKEGELKFILNKTQGQAFTLV